MRFLKPLHVIVVYLLTSQASKNFSRSDKNIYLSDTENILTWIIVLSKYINSIVRCILDILSCKSKKKNKNTNSVLLGCIMCQATSLFFLIKGSNKATSHIFCICLTTYWPNTKSQLKADNVF